MMRAAAASVAWRPERMRLALLYPEPSKGGRGKKSLANTSAKRGGLSMDRIDNARAVLAYSREFGRGGGSR